MVFNCFGETAPNVRLQPFAIVNLLPQIQLGGSRIQDHRSGDNRTCHGTPSGLVHAGDQQPLGPEQAFPLQRRHERTELLRWSWVYLRETIRSLRRADLPWRDRR